MVDMCQKMDMMLDMMKSNMYRSICEKMKVKVIMKIKIRVMTKMELLKMTVTLQGRPLETANDH